MKMEFVLVCSSTSIADWSGKHHTNALVFPQTMANLVSKDWDQFQYMENTEYNH